MLILAVANRNKKLKFSYLFVAKFFGLIGILIIGIIGFFFFIFNLFDFLKGERLPISVFFLTLFLPLGMGILPLILSWRSQFFRKSPVEIIINEDTKEILYRCWPWQKYNNKSIKEIEEIETYIANIFFPLTFSKKKYEKINTVIELRFKDKERIFIYPYYNFILCELPITSPFYYLSSKKIFKENLEEKGMKEGEEIISIISGLKNQKDYK